MTKYTEAKAIVLNEMFHLNQRMELLINGLEALDRLEDMDLHDQITTMMKAQKAMAAVIERSFLIDVVDRSLEVNGN